MLAGVREHPGAGNREFVKHVGITDQGQVFKLLARLERLGPLANSGEGHGKGEPNAWLTPWRVEIHQAIHARGNRANPEEATR